MKRRQRILALLAAGLVTAAVAAGVALARTSVAIGTGVVVIQTRLGYEGGNAAGTGMVLASGEILTNNHVIAGATAIRIVLPGTGHAYTATVVGYDVADDVAVLKASGASNLQTVTTGNSAAVKVGDSVKAIGNANGSGTLTTVTGRITGLRRSIQVGDGQITESLTGMIETNAALQPGDSGGPLYDASGKVIGIDTAASAGFGYASTATQGYAIPIVKALTIAKQIDAGKASARVHIGGTAFLGVQVQPSFSGYGSDGVVIAGLVSGGPAATAGLVEGDTITAIDGKAITTSSTLTTRILAAKPGTKVTLVYVDQFGSTHTVRITLASGPAQ